MKKFIIGVVAVAAVALSCGEEEGVTPREPDRFVPTSPANVLKNVELAFNNRDINLLKAMLSENFVFYFDPRDVGQSLPGEPHYKIPSSRAEFLHAAQNMFDKAYSINLSIPTGRISEPEAEETTYRADNVDVYLLVMVDEENGFIADQGYCNFAFEKYTTAGGGKYWRLTGWWDRTAVPADGLLGVKPTSVGRILAIYS